MTSIMKTYDPKTHDVMKISTKRNYLIKYQSYKNTIVEKEFEISDLKMDKEALEQVIENYVYKVESDQKIMAEKDRQISSLTEKFDILMSNHAQPVEATTEPASATIADRNSNFTVTTQEIPCAPARNVEPDSICAHLKIPTTVVESEVDSIAKPEPTVAVNSPDECALTNPDDLVQRVLKLEQEQQATSQKVRELFRTVNRSNESLLF